MTKLYTKGSTVTDEVLSGAERYDIKEDAGTAYKTNMQVVLATPVAVAGTVIDAARINNMEDGIDAADTILSNAGLNNTDVLTPANDDILQRKSGKWVNRTIAQYITDITAGLSALFFKAEGWIPVSGTWTYASASTITIPTDGTTVYQKGIKIRLKQGGGYKYYVGTTVAATLITVLVNTDYTVANAAITDVSYSYVENPLGWPSAFNVTITTEGLTTPSYNSQAGKVQVLGRTLKFDGRVDINSWAGQTGYIKIVIPFAVTHVGGTGRGVGSYYRTGTSTQQGTHQLSTLTATTFGLVDNAAADTIAWEASARVVFQFQFLCDF